MIVTFATPKYQHWLDLLLESYRISNPQGQAKVYLVNFDRHNYKSDGLVEFAEMKFDSPPKDGIPGAKIEALMRIKLTILLYELILNQRNMFWLDADCVVLKDLSPLLEKLNTYDMLCTKRPDMPEHRRTQAAMFGVSPGAIKSLAKWSKLSWAYATNWWSDQVSLGKMAEEVNAGELSVNEFVFKNEDPQKAFVFTRGGKDYQLCRELSGLEEKEWISPTRLTP